MAQIFLSESSRRNQGISDEEMEERWAKAFGPQKKQTCSQCGQETPITKDGVCTDCNFKRYNLDTTSNYKRYVNYDAGEPFHED